MHFSLTPFNGTVLLTMSKAQPVENGPKPIRKTPIQQNANAENQAD